jgi:hypothetical protein
MSVEASPGLVIADVIPSFPSDLMTRELTTVRAMPADQFRHEQLAAMGAENPALEVLHGEYIGHAGQRYGEDGPAQGGMGLLFAHHVLSLAARLRGTRLPLLSPDQALDYEYWALTIPERLVAEFTRDYAGHTAVVSLVEEGLTKPASKEGAMLLFGLFGGLAKPDRPDITVRSRPKPKTGPTLTQKRSLEAVTGQRRRRAA